MFSGAGGLASCWKNMDELKRKHQTKNDPRTQTFPLYNWKLCVSCFPLAIFVFLGGGHSCGACAKFPQVYMNKTMKQRKTIWMASIASFYHLQIYPIGISSAVLSLVNNNLSRCSWFLQAIWQLLPPSTTPAVHSSIHPGAGR